MLFPVMQGPVNAAMPPIKVFNANLFRWVPLKNRFFTLLWTSIFFYLESKLSRVLKARTPALREYILAKVIQYYKPDLVHSLEMQLAGYLTLGAKRRMGNKFPKWAVSIWGSDIYLFGRLKEHRTKIQEVLASCDYFFSETERDIPLAHGLGFSGKVLPALPASGAFDLEYCLKYKQAGPVSDRKTILLKGYQHFAGRALVGLRALALCSDLLKGYRVEIFGASRDVLIAAELFSHSTGIPVDILSTAHDAGEDEILKAFGRARMAIGLSISDGLPRTLLEAMIMGAFPIQSDTSSASEWIQDGRSGFIVPPEDPQVISEAIRKALVNDELVNEAASINSKTVAERLSEKIVQPQIVQVYKDLLG